MRNTSTTLSNQLVLALQTARAEAIRRGTWVEVVSVNGDGKWGKKGWQVVADVNFDHVFNGTDTATGTLTSAPAAPTQLHRLRLSDRLPTGIGGERAGCFQSQRER